MRDKTDRWRVKEKEEGGRKGDDEQYEAETQVTHKLCRRVSQFNNRYIYILFFLRSTVVYPVHIPIRILQIGSSSGIGSVGIQAGYSDGVIA